MIFVCTQYTTLHKSTNIHFEKITNPIVASQDDFLLSKSICEQVLSKLNPSDPEYDFFKEALDKQTNILQSKNARVENKDFLRRAPKEIVVKERESIAEIENTIKRLEQIYNELR